MIVCGCTDNPASSFVVTEQIEIGNSGVIVSYPVDWFLAEVSLTPNLANPREVFSVGSFPLRPGGPNCAQVPSNALHDMRPGDVLVSVQERFDAIASGFPDRPDRFGPAPGTTDNELYGCLDPEESDDIGAIHWIWFTDQDRYFHVIVALGSDVGGEREKAAWAVLDDLVIAPAD
ncbi:MAG: hypothetical protein PVG83_00710 [Acidimicrobiia bacterium]|jgi:hypothetical protein